VIASSPEIKARKSLEVDASGTSSSFAEAGRLKLLTTGMVVVVVMSGSSKEWNGCFAGNQDDRNSLSERKENLRWV
jgi:hypothetical protein